MKNIGSRLALYEIVLRSWLKLNFEPTNLEWVILDMRLTLRLKPYLPKLFWLMQVRHEDESSLTLYAVV